MAKAQISLKLVNMQQVKERLTSQMTRHIPRNVRAALARIALRLVGEMRRSIQRHASQGRAYKRGDKWHRASVPHFTPNTDTGNLANLIIADFSTSERAVFVRSMAKYSRALEHGSMHRRGGKSWYIFARPFVKPAVEKLRPWAMAELRRALRLPGPG